MAVSVTAQPDRATSVLRYFDVLLVLMAAPIMLLIGVSPAGYVIGGAAWLALRAVGVAVDRYAAELDLTRSTAVRMVYMMGRLFALAIVVILVRQSDGKGAGLACLAVIVLAFTISLAVSGLTRPKRSRPR